VTTPRTGPTRPGRDAASPARRRLPRGALILVVLLGSGLTPTCTARAAGEAGAGHPWHEGTLDTAAVASRMDSLQRSWESIDPQSDEDYYTIGMLKLLYGDLADLVGRRWVADSVYVSLQDEKWERFERFYSSASEQALQCAVLDRRIRSLIRKGRLATAAALRSSGGGVSCYSAQSSTSPRAFDVNEEVRWLIALCEADEAGALQEMERAYPVIGPACKGRTSLELAEYLLEHRDCLERAMPGVGTALQARIQATRKGALIDSLLSDPTVPADIAAMAREVRELDRDIVDASAEKAGIDAKQNAWRTAMGGMGGQAAISEHMPMDVFFLSGEMDSSPLGPRLRRLTQTRDELYQRLLKRVADE
jgi:hypothetical protein